MNKKVIIGIIATVIIGGVTYFILKKRKNRNEKTGEEFSLLIKNLGGLNNRQGDVIVKVNQYDTKTVEVRSNKWLGIYWFEFDESNTIAGDTGNGAITMYYDTTNFPSYKPSWDSAWGQWKINQGGKEIVVQGYDDMGLRPYRTFSNEDVWQNLSNVRDYILTEIDKK